MGRRHIEWPWIMFSKHAFGVVSRVVGLDLEFYRDFYPDLSAFGDPRSLVIHYIRVGRREGRLANLDAFRLAEEQLHGSLPLDFNPSLYAALNPDVGRACPRPWEQIRHYLQHGRNEGRRYAAQDPEVQEAFRNGQGFRNWSDLTRAHGFEPGRWIDLFDPYVYGLLDTDWCGPPASRPVAVEHFLRHGLANLTPIAFDLAFSPAYDREIHDRDPAETNVDLYKRWLALGLPAGEPGSPEAHLGGLGLGLADFPDAFDWRRWCSRHGLASGRWLALDDLMSRGLDFEDIPIAAAPAAPFLEALAEAFLRRGDPASSLRALEAVGAMNGRRQDILISALLGLDRWADALEAYAAHPGQPDRDSHEAAAKAAVHLGAPEKALAILRRSASRLSGVSSWRDVAEKARAQAIAAGDEPTAAGIGDLLFFPAPPGLDPRKPRVLLVNTFFPPDNIGGATAVVRENLNDWQAVGALDRFDVMVACADLAGAWPGAIRMDVAAGVPVFRIAVRDDALTDWRHEDSDVEAAFAQVLKTARPDMVHFHSVQRLTASVVRACAAAKIPYLITVHDSWWLSDWQFFVDDLGQWATTPGQGLPPGVTTAASVERRQVLASHLRAATRILAVSEWCADRYRRAGVRETQALPNGLPDRLPVTRTPRTTPFLHLAFIGGRARIKGYDLLRAALSRGQYTNLRATVVDQHRTTGACVERWGETLVTVIPPIPPDGMGAFLAGMDVLAAPSVAPETYGLAVREALAAGLWVITSDRGAAAEAVTPGQNGFVVDVSDTGALGEALRHMNEWPERYRAPPKLHPLNESSTLQAGRLMELYLDITAARDST